MGLAPNKVVAKLASKWAKPSGFTAIQARDIHLYIKDLPVEKVWGVGPQTTALLAKFGIRTALDFARKDEDWVVSHLTKRHVDIWRELNGRFAIDMELGEKSSYASIQKMKTFTPPSSDRAFVFAQLAKNIENATMKARRYQLAARGAVVFVKAQDFRSRGMEVKFSRKTALPQEILEVVSSLFGHLFNPNEQYRATGVVLFDLEDDRARQLDLFGAALKAERIRRMYEAVDVLRAKYGKHTLYLGASHLANRFAHHLGERGDIPKRKESLLKGETARRHLGIPMFMGTVM